MKFSELLEEYIDMRLDGEPKDNGWTSIDEMSRRSQEYYGQLEALMHEMDCFISGAHL